MKKNLVLVLILVSAFSFAQKASLGQYYSFCEKVADFSEKDEGILEIYKNENKWVIKANVMDNCLVRLYPDHKIVSDTLKIEFLEITEYKIELENGDSFAEVLPAYDCLCLYEVRMDFNLEEINHLIINNSLIKKNAFVEK